MANRDRPGLNDRFQERPSAMPYLGQDRGADPRRTPAGAPLAPVERAGQLVSDQVWGECLLIEELDEKQRAEDNAEWWRTASDYIRKTAAMTDTGQAFFRGIGFTGQDLITRLSRTEKLETLEVRLAKLLQWVRNTMTVERAALVRMADVPVSEAEMLLGTVQLPAEDRRTLKQLSEDPLAVWQKEREGRQRTQKDRGALRRERDTAARRAEDAEAALAQGEAVHTTMNLPPTPPAPPRKATRKTPR